jgi:hypothetical protein
MDGAGRDVSAPVVLLCATLLAGILRQGAFYPPGQLVLGAGIAAAVVASVASRRPVRGESTWPPLVAAGACGAWSLADAALHGSTVAGVPGAALVLGLAGVLFVVRRSPAADRETLLAAVIVIGALLAATAWLGLVLHVPRWALVAAGVWRGSGAVSYPNATACVLAVTALLALGHIAVLASAPDGGERALLPAPAPAVLATLTLAGLGATLSRGGALALLAGMLAALLAALLAGRETGRPQASWRRSALPTAGPIVGGALACVGLMPLTSHWSPVRAVVALVTLGGGVALALAVRRGSVRWGRREPLGLPRGVAVMALVAGVSVVAAGAAVLAGPHLDRLASTRWHLGSDHRVEAARAALAQVARNPLTGVGPGAGSVTWRESDGASLTARYVHDEYLQLLLEQGLIGAVLLVLFVAACARDAWRGAGRGARRHGWRDGWRARAAPSGGGVARGAGWAATVAFAVHSGLDFLWHVPALPVLAAAVFAATLASRVPVRAGADGGPGGSALLPEASLASGRSQVRED